MPRIIKLEYANAGVDGGTGYEFQKNCLLYVILSNYVELEGREYCVFMEHYDDFVICFFENGYLAEVYTYQAKKHSGDWTTSEIVPDVLYKICVSGAAARQDSTFDRSNGYKQLLSFISNQRIKIKNNTIDNSNDEIYLKNLSESGVTHCKELIIEQLKQAIFIERQRLGLVDSSKQFLDWYKELSYEEKASFNQEVECDPVYQEIENVRFIHIDMPGTNIRQVQLLRSMLVDACQGKIAFPDAAYNVLLKLITDSSTTYNTGGEITFNNFKKKISSSAINDCIGMLKNSSMAIKEWREKIDVYGKSLNIPIPKQKEFISELETSFEFLKDKSKIEHQQILELSKAEYEITTATNREDFINSVYKKYIETSATRLSETRIKAICYAASFELF